MGGTNTPEFPATLYVIAKYMQLLLAAISVALCFFTKSNWVKVAILSIIVTVLYGGDIPYHYDGVLFFPTIVQFFNKQTYTQKDILYVLLFCLFLNPFPNIFIVPIGTTFLANIALLLIWGLLLIDILKEVKPRLLLKKTFLFNF
ncbi:hypothetical protein AGMMS4957_06920 [Bacteroidia bacterium]|nr:hypothetical protein AGMMS4957_06920 [Bacteroidia bacterium]